MDFGIAALCNNPAAILSDIGVAVSVKDVQTVQVRILRKYEVCVTFLFDLHPCLGVQW